MVIIYTIYYYILLYILKIIFMFLIFGFFPTVYNTVYFIITKSYNVIVTFN